MAIVATTEVDELEATTVLFIEVKGGAGVEANVFVLLITLCGVNRSQRAISGLEFLVSITQT